MTGSRLGTRERRCGSRFSPLIASVARGILPGDEIQKWYRELSEIGAQKEAGANCRAGFLSIPQRAIEKSVEPWLDDRCKRVPCAIQTRLYRAEIAVRDLRDLFVRLSFQLAQHEHLAMMFR